MGDRTNGGQAFPNGAYRGFQGRVGRTFRSSEPWWPEPRRAPEGAPNVVVVLVDDLGFSDLGCYGSEIPTPNIDALAARGTRYGNFHVTPLCSPTRAALMTGRNSHAAGVGFVAHVRPGFPGYVSELPENQPTLAEVFRSNGYSTFAVGKWHLAYDADYSEAGDRRSWPLQRGFDDYYGFLDALTNSFHPHRMYRGNSVVDVDEYPEDYYLTDDLTDHAIRMVRGAHVGDPDKPFFLYVAPGAVHAPLHARAEDIARYRGDYDAGWDVLRERRLARQKELGVVTPATELPPRNSEENEDVVAWDDVEDRLKPLYARYMEVYAAMVENVDHNVGRIAAALDELGRLDNTVFVVTSDNGASREGQATGSTHYGRGVTPEPGKREFSAESLERDLERIDDIGGPNSWPHYPRGWAMACNTPFRLYKTTTFAGGHQVALVVSWPDGLEQRGEIVRTQYAHVTDIMPTLVDLIGLEMPKERHGQAADPLAGASFAGTLHDPEARTEHDEQYYECFGNRALYQDGWEVVTYRVPNRPFSEDHWHLFHTAEDPTQLTDLADEHPDRVEEMASRWDEVAWENQVFPLYEGGGTISMIRPEWEERLARPTTFVPSSPTADRYRSSKLITGRPFRIEVAWEYQQGDQGVVLAHGGQDSGYVLYVEDGLLHLLVNATGDEHRLDPVPLGASSQELVVDVERPGNGVWTITLSVDGRAAARAEGVPHMTSYYPYEGIDVGIDRRSPVSWELYERHGSFPFSGTIHEVTYVPGELSPDADVYLMEEARAMGAALE